MAVGSGMSDGIGDHRGAGAGSDPVTERYKRDLDRSLLRENLRKTPEERVRALVALQALAEEARRAGRLRTDRG